MKISSLFNKVSFKKTLVAHCSILKKDNVSFPCKIYSLNQKDDSDYFETIENKADWKGAKYLCYLKDDLKSIDDKPNRNIYVLQSEQGDCLGYSEIDYGENGIDEVLFLETVPTQNYSRRDKSSFKYIGETLLSFLLKKSKEKKAKRIEIQSSIASANFYKNKCLLRVSPKEANLFYLNKKDFSRLIKQNEEHTKSTIELVV